MLLARLGAVWILLAAQQPSPVPLETPSWLLVRGTPERIAGADYERLGRAYLLGAPFRIVGADQARSEPASSRLVIGSVDDLPLAGELAAAFGIELARGRFRHAGRRQERTGAGLGLVAIGPDPDGHGLLRLFTGTDAAGLEATLRRNVDVMRPGWLLIQGQRIELSGGLGPEVDGSRPTVVRLDLDALHLASEAGIDEDGIDEDSAVRIARGLQAYSDVLARVGAAEPLDYGRWLLGPGAAPIERTTQFFAGRDLAGEVLAGHRRCVEALGVQPGLQPAFFLLLGDPAGTNAATMDADPWTHRPRVALNLCALARGRHFDAAVLHESVHLVQTDLGRTLLERAVCEGVATRLAQAIDPTLSDSDALFWTAEELAAAEEHRGALLTLFREHAHTTAASRSSGFITLGARLPEIPGAPSRSGYYLGWLAAGAWLDAHANALPELLRAEPGAVFAALKE